MRYETRDLLAIIGQKEVEIDALRTQLNLLIPLRCPDKEAHQPHQEKAHGGDVDG